MSVHFKVEGMKELQAQLEKLKTGTARAALTRAGIRALRPTAELAARLAPEDSGELKSSIAVGAKTSSGGVGDAEYSGVLSAGGSKQEAVAARRDARRAVRGERGQLYVDLFMGPRSGRSKDDEIKGLVMEFGSARLQPRPYMRPAFEMDKEAILARLRVDLWDEIQKSLARAAKRAGAAT